MWAANPELLSTEKSFEVDGVEVVRGFLKGHCELAMPYDSQRSEASVDVEVVRMLLRRGVDYPNQQGRRIDCLEGAKPTGS